MSAELQLKSTTVGEKGMNGSILAAEVLAFYFSTYTLKGDSIEILKKKNGKKEHLRKINSP